MCLGTTANKLEIRGCRASPSPFRLIPTSEGPSSQSFSPMIGAQMQERGHAGVVTQKLGSRLVICRQLSSPPTPTPKLSSFKWVWVLCFESLISGIFFMWSLW